MRKSILFFVFFLLISIYPVQAKTDEYILVDYKTETKVKNVSTLKQAWQFYELLKEDYDNLAIVQNEKIIAIEYGIISINSGSCSVNFEFKYDSNNQDGYTNGCYGDDALYLETNNSGTKVKFMISGAVGWGNLSQVEIIPISKVQQLSSYKVIDGILFHQIKTNLSSNKYGGLAELTEAPKELEEGKIYLSYDGHYFYGENQFETMVDDIRNEHHNHSLNQLPYYNYYQIVSHRTLTNASVEQIEKYFQEELMIKNQLNQYRDLDNDSVHDSLTQSQYIGNEFAFFSYQNKYGANALMMLALSMNETARGRSSLAYTRNNLFGHAAYDSDVEKNASRYFNVSNSVLSHAKNYISKSYLNPEKFQYHGGFFGDKASGMNVSYASDPYWGEKAAQYYKELDEVLGKVDYNSISLAIKSNETNIDILDEKGNVLYQTGKIPHLSFVVLEELDDKYKIQLDPAIYPIQSEYTYSFKSNVGYILKEDVEIVLNRDQIKENKMIDVWFSAGDGTFSDGLNLAHYEFKEGALPVSEIPVKENAIFDKWDKKLSKAKEEIIYTAIYRNIDSIQMYKMPKTEYKYNDRIDLKEGSIQITYEDGEKEIIPITTSMVSNYNTKQSGLQEIRVNYGGAYTCYTINVEEENNIKQEIDNALKEYNGEPSEWLKLKDKMIKEDYFISSNKTIRDLEQLIYPHVEGLSIVIKKNNVNLSVSGLLLANESKTLFDKKWLKDTISFEIKENISEKNKEYLEKVIEANDFEPITLFKLTGKYNFRPLELSMPIVVSMDIPEGIDTNEIINVFMLIENEVVKLPTQQSLNKVTFRCDEFGEFIIAKRDSVNEYTGTDPIETHTYLTNGTNYPQLIFIFGCVLLTILFLLCILVLNKKARVTKKRS